MIYLGPGSKPPPAPKKNGQAKVAASKQSGQDKNYVEDSDIGITPDQRVGSGELDSTRQMSEMEIQVCKYKMIDD